jgi:hypothetical protein
MAVHPSQAVSAAATGGALAGPIGAAVGIGGSLLNSMFQGIANRRQNKRMVDFWKMNNEYNHPSAQMARLREAGLNPNLIYGSSASGAAGNSSGAPTPETDPVSIGNPLAAYQQTKLFKLQSDNLRAQNTVLLNDAALKAVNTVKAGVQGNLSKQQLSILEQTAADIAAQARQKTLQDYAETTTKQQAVDLNVQRLQLGEQNISNAAKLAKLRDLEAQLKQKGLDYYDAQAIMGLVTRLLGIPQLK